VITSVSFSPDGLSVVSGSWDETVRVRDVSTGEEIEWNHKKSPTFRYQIHETFSLHNVVVHK
jgi:WD40 repeat protein